MYCAENNVSSYTAVIDCLPGYTGGEELEFAVYKYAVNIDKVRLKNNVSFLCRTI